MKEEEGEKLKTTVMWKKGRRKHKAFLPSTTFKIESSIRQRRGKGRFCTRIELLAVRRWRIKQEGEGFIVKTATARKVRAVEGKEERAEAADLVRSMEKGKEETRVVKTFF